MGVVHQRAHLLALAVLAAATPVLGQEPCPALEAARPWLAEQLSPWVSEHGDLECSELVFGGPGRIRLGTAVPSEDAFAAPGIAQADSPSGRLRIVIDSEGDSGHDVALEDRDAGTVRNLFRSGTAGAWLSARWLSEQTVLVMGWAEHHPPDAEPQCCVDCPCRVVPTVTIVDLQEGTAVVGVGPAVDWEVVHGPRG